MMTVIASPFERLPQPALEGRGLNPLLEVTDMLVHPLLLYTGYVGFVVPFSFAMAALLAGRLDGTWLTLTRRWTVTAWLFLTSGILYGGWWSYRTLGWGGYWAWDPVENASFMPWLMGTAFVHSVMVQERRPMLKIWNMALITLTFALTIFGTFLTRSGVISSVHAFASGAIGPFLLAYLAAILLTSLGLLVWRWDRLGERAELDALLSRESVFLVNNVLLVAFCFTVFMGTIFPLARGGRDGGQGLGRDAVLQLGDRAHPAGHAPADGGGPAGALAPRVLARPRASPPRARRRRPRREPPDVADRRPAARARRPRLHPARTSWPLSCSASSGGPRGAAAARPASPGRRPSAGSSRRTTGATAGLVVHLGVVLVAIGVATSTVGKIEREATLKRGETLELGRYAVRFTGLSAGEEPTHLLVQAALEVSEAGRPAGTLRPGQRLYPGSSSPFASVAVRYGFVRDFYVILGAFDRQGEWAQIKAQVHPMIAWIWLGGLVVLMGGGLALWPAGRRAPVDGARRRRSGDRGRRPRAAARLTVAEPGALIRPCVGAPPPP